MKRLLILSCFLTSSWLLSPLPAVAQKDSAKAVVAKDDRTKIDIKKLNAEAILLMTVPVVAQDVGAGWPEVETVCPDASPKGRHFVMSPREFKSGYEDKTSGENACVHEGSLLNGMKSYTLAVWVKKRRDASTPLYRELDAQGEPRMTVLLTAREALRTSIFNSDTPKNDGWTVGVVASEFARPVDWCFVALRFNSELPEKAMSIRIDNTIESVTGQMLKYPGAGISIVGGYASVVREVSLFPRALTDHELDALFVQGGGQLVAATETGKVDIKAAPTGESNLVVKGFVAPKMIAELAGPKGSINQVCFFPNGKLVAAVSDDPALWVWVVPSGELKYTIPVDRLPREVNVSPDGKLIVVAGSGGPRLYAAENGKLMGNLGPDVKDGSSPASHACVFAKDSETIFFAIGSELRKLDLAHGNGKASGDGPWGGIRHIALSHDGKRLVTACNNSQAVVWDADELKEVARFTGQSNKVYGSTISPDDKLVATSSYDNTVCLWEMETGQLVRRFVGHKEGVKSVEFSPDGHRLASGSYDGSVRLWDVATGQQLWVSEHLGANHVAFSPDGRYLICGGGYISRTVKMAESESKKVTLFELSAETKPAK